MRDVCARVVYEWNIKRKSSVGTMEATFGDSLLDGEKRVSNRLSLNCVSVKSADMGYANSTVR